MSIRCLYFFMFALAIIHLFHSFSYTIIIQIQTALVPLTNFDKPIQINESQPEKELQILNTNINRQESHLTKALAANKIYEAGHTFVNLKICPDNGKNIKVLIAITSAPTHERTRLAIRETWGNSLRRDVAVAFILGTSLNLGLNKKIEKEQRLYGDIIVGKFVDTYENLTLKTISMLEWVGNYCPKTAFLLKTDDDVFINVSKLLTFIAKHNPKQRAIYGRLAKQWKPVRKKKSKYYISFPQYRSAVFPDFTTGPAYLIPAHLAKELYAAASNHTYFKLEDVFVTGIIANGLKIKRIHVPEFLNRNANFSPCKVQKVISIHTVKNFEQYYVWKKLHEVAKCKK